MKYKIRGEGKKEHNCVFPLWCPNQAGRKEQTPSLALSQTHSHTQTNRKMHSRGQWKTGGAECERYKNREGKRESDV